MTERSLQGASSQLDLFKLLAATAKALGKQIEQAGSGIVFDVTDPSDHKIWHPHLDDAEAFRVAAALDMDLFFSKTYQEVTAVVALLPPVTIAYGGDKLAAARMAILRCAASAHQPKEREWQLR